MTWQINHLAAKGVDRRKSPPAREITEASQPTWTDAAARAPKRVSRAERKARQKKVAIEVLVKGNRIDDVARWYQLSKSHVYYAMHEFRHELKFKSRREIRREKLLALAKRVRKGEHITQLAKENHVAKIEISLICRELGMKVPRGRPKGVMAASSKRYLTVDWSLKNVQIAQQLKCSYQAVSQMRQKLVRLGLIPPRPTPLRKKIQRGRS